MLTIVLGYKTRTEAPKALYLGIDGVAGDRAALAAQQSGDYVGGRITKLIHPMEIPCPTVPTTKPAEAPKKPAKK